MDFDLGDVPSGLRHLRRDPVLTIELGSIDVARDVEMRSVVEAYVRLRGRPHALRKSFGSTILANK